MYINILPSYTTLSCFFETFIRALISYICAQKKMYYFVLVTFGRLLSQLEHIHSMILETQFGNGTDAGSLYPLVNKIS